MKFDFIESAEITDVGRKRGNNEDACLRLPEWGVFCIADGMGGGTGGELASTAVKKSLLEVFGGPPPSQPGVFSMAVELFHTGVNQASKWIKDYSDEKVTGTMGTTVVALICDEANPRRAVGLHAGDSRLYLFREGCLRCLTADHSAVAAVAVKLGLEPASLPARFQNELVRAVGLKHSVALEETAIELQSGDLLFLCSDGLTKMLRDEEIAEALKTGATKPAIAIARTLVEMANEAGGKDNISVILVKIGNIDGHPVIAAAPACSTTLPSTPVESAPATETKDPLTPPTATPATTENDDTPEGNTPKTELPPSLLQT